MLLELQRRNIVCAEEEDWLDLHSRPIRRHYSRVPGHRKWQIATAD